MYIQKYNKIHEKPQNVKYKICFVHKLWTVVVGGSFP